MLRHSGHNSSFDITSNSSFSFSSLRRSGRVYQTFCPYHDEKHPSFTIYPDDFGGHYYCFSCGRHGTLRSIGYTFEGGCLTPLSKENPPIMSKPPSPREIPRPEITPEKLDALTEASCNYHHFLMNHKEALDYLQNVRGLSLITIAQYLLGYANGVPLMSCYPKSERTSLILKLSDAGLLTTKGGDYFHGCITIPDFSLDEKGKISDIIGRGFPEKMHRKLPADKVKRTALYLEKCAKDALVEGNDILLIIEGPIDTLTLRQADFNAVGVPGVHSFNNKDAVRLRGYGFRHIIVAFDGDEAGVEGSLRIASQIGKKTKVLPFPKGFCQKDGTPVKDWNELFVHVFNKNISSFREYLQGLIDKLLGGDSYVHTRHLNPIFQNEVQTAQKVITIPFSSSFTPGGGTLIFAKNDPQTCMAISVEKLPLLKCYDSGISKEVGKIIFSGNSWQKNNFVHEFDHDPPPRSSWLGSIIDKAKEKILAPLHNWITAKKQVLIYLVLLVSWGEARGFQELVKKVKSCGSGWIKERHKESNEERFRNIACGERQLCPRDSYYYYHTLFNNTKEVILSIIDGLISMGILIKTGFKAVAYELTIPKEISEYLDGLVKDDLQKWDMIISDLKKSVVDYLKKVDCVPTGFSRFHYLSSSRPWLVHYHFHILLIPASKKNGEWHRIRRFLDPNDLDQCKEIWAKIIKKWAKKWNIPGDVPEKLNLKRHYFKDIVKLCFNIKYCLRSILHDFIKGLCRQEGDKVLFISKDPEGKKIEKWLSFEEVYAIFDRVRLYHTSESYKGKKFRNFRLMSWFGALAPNQKKKLLPDFDLIECDEESPWERVDDNVYTITGWNKTRNTVKMKVCYVDLGMGYKSYQEDAKEFEIPADRLVWDRPLGVVKVKKIWRRKGKEESRRKEHAVA